MPKRTDIETILIIGSGPIVIGQACEFDYSGTQACKALREEGYRVVLVNSNPATIMTDPQFSDRTYIEPVTPEAVAKVIERERPDALLPTLGGQTGLNVAVKLAESGVLEKYGVEMIGADLEAIHKAEDRKLFKQAMEEAGLQLPKSGLAYSMADAWAVLEEVGLPAIIRPSFTLGGTGGGIAYNRDEFEEIASRGIEYSMINEILVEESVIGWKEYEMEVMRDRLDNVVIICSIENFDPMGVHTGDSITVAPAQTLTDKEYQLMRDASIKVIRSIGVETGGSNIQFAVDPDTGRMTVIEMNPRVSRSSALASKATGFPIAKIAAKLAVGYTLDEIPNDITRETPACFEPTIDYTVVKIPRWTFEKFPEANETLTTQMKSVGEAMSIGRTFKEALQKGIRSMEVKRFGLGLDANDKWLKSLRSNAECGMRNAESGGTPPRAGAQSAEEAENAASVYPIPEEKLLRKLNVPSQGRLYYVRYALKMGYTVDQVHQHTNIDPWFLRQIEQLVQFEDELLAAGSLADASEGLLRQAKQWGYSDVQLATIWNCKQSDVRARRRELGIVPVYKLVDTCAAEFEAYTPYFYSTYETPYTTVAVEDAALAAVGAGGEKVEVTSPVCYAEEKDFAAGAEHPASSIQHLTFDDEIRVTDKKKVVILGGGPNRIGQGIEFDYCCVHAVMAMREMGFEAVMINSNPETVSTDYDTSDLLFFEPLTHEDVLNICERLNGGPLLPPLQDFTGLRDKPKPVVPEGQSVPNLTNLDFSIPAGRFDTIRCEVQSRGWAPAGIVGMVVSPGHPADASCNIYFVLCSDGQLKSFGFNAEEPAKLMDVDDADSAIAAESLDEAVLVRAKEALAGGGGLLHGVIVQFGGQTPLNLARGLADAGVPIIGTTPESIALAEDREQFNALLDRLGIDQPPGRIVFDAAAARAAAEELGYPVLVRPSYVLGGRAMEIVYDEAALDHYMTFAVEASEEHPVLVDKFLDQAIEMDVDAIADGTGRVIVCGLMEHIEEAGIHSGDSACALPPYSLAGPVVERVRDHTVALARALDVRGLMNVQFAIRDDQVYVLEVNPRASRTVPFVSKATGVPWAKLAAKAMAGATLDEQGASDPPRLRHTAVKESVFPFNKFPGVDVILGPEMRSTGEVMGLDEDFAMAFAKSQIAAGLTLPEGGKVFVSVRDADKPHVAAICQRLAELGFELLSTRGTAAVLEAAGVPVTPIRKIAEGRPNILDYIKNFEIKFIINTPTRKGLATDEGKLRATAVIHNVPLVTTITGARAAARAIGALAAGDGYTVAALQDYFPAKG